MDAHQRAEIAKRSRRPRPVTPRPNAKGNPYQFSSTFIRRMTVVLCIAIVVLPIAGFIYGATLGSDYEEWQSAIALTLIVGGFGLPLLAAAVLGGEAIRRGGGFVGLLFTLGLIGGPTGSTFGIGWLAVAGYIALGLSVILFFVIGFASKVPMWIGSRDSKTMSWNDPENPNTTNT